MVKPSTVAIRPLKIPWGLVHRHGLKGYIEPGIGGIFQLSDYPLYPYGAVSYLISGSDGHDIYNSGTRGYGDFEKLYAGLIWDLPGEQSLLDVSVGRQIYQIRDGFLQSSPPR